MQKPPPFGPDNSDSLRYAADQLSARIKIFEEWLANQPGFKCKTVTPFVDTPGGRVSLAFEKWTNGLWSLVLVWPITEPDFPAAQTRELLRDSSMRNKLSAVALFPKLVEQIKAEQAKNLNQIHDAVIAFDEFAAKLGIDISSKPTTGGA